MNNLKLAEYKKDINAVVVVKRKSYMGYKIKIRYYSTLDNKHIFKNLFVPEYEFNLYNWEEFPYEIDEPEFNED